MYAACSTSCPSLQGKTPALLFTDHPARLCRFHQAKRLKEPSFFRGKPRGFHQPPPLLHKKGLQTTPQTPRQSLARDLTENFERPSFSEFWYGSQSLCPFGASHGLDIPAVAAPWKGAHHRAHCRAQPIKKHPGPLMVRGYLNVRATGGAVKPPANNWREVWRVVRSLPG